MIIKQARKKKKNMRTESRNIQIVISLNFIFLQIHTKIDTHTNT